MICSDIRLIKVILRKSLKRSNSSRKHNTQEMISVSEALSL